MGNEPLISIIVPIYKVEDYLDRCIQSILNQSYKNIEIILVDDGSPDRCGSICDAYALTDSRVKVIHKENGGLSDARNAGLEVANGSLIGFVDSDDLIHPRMYEFMLHALTSTHSDISICYYTAFSTETPKHTESPSNYVVINNIQAMEALFSFDAVNFTLTWNKLYKAELFEQIRFPKGKTREDEFTTHQILYKAHKIVFLKKHLYYYFERPDSIMRENSMMNEFNYTEAQESRLDFFHKNGLKNLENTTLRKYCIWLMATLYRYKQQPNSNDTLFIVTIKKRKSEYIHKLLREVPLSFWSRCLYFLSLTFFAKPLDYCAFRRIYRNDPIAGFLLNDSLQKII